MIPIESVLNIRIMMTLAWLNGNGILHRTEAGRYIPCIVDIDRSTGSGARSVCHSNVGAHRLDGVTIVLFQQLSRFRL